MSGEKLPAKLPALWACFQNSNGKLCGAHLAPVETALCSVERYLPEKAIRALIEKLKDHNQSRDTLDRELDQLLSEYEK